MKIFKQTLVAAGLLALLAAPAFAYEPGTFVLRGGVGTIDPKSDNLTYLYDDGFESFEACVDIDNGTSVMLNGTYMINEHWAFDVLAALPFKHDIKASIDIVVDDGLDFTTETFKVGETKQLPPTFSFQYHFSPDGDFQPYVGLGMNWTTFFSTKLHPDQVDDEVDKLILDDSFGVAAQLGGDWLIGDHTVVNFDVRYMDIDSDIFVHGPGLDAKQKLGTAEIDPWIYAVSLGYRF